MKSLKRILISAFLVSTAFTAPVSAEESMDTLDQMLARVVGGAAGESGAFYEALFKASLVVVAEETGLPADGSAPLVLAHRVQNDKKIIDVYTSAAQLALDPEPPTGKPVQMQGRELFALIGQTGCDVAVNAHTGHGGQFTAKKIQELLAKA